jgi:hypothetical protein
MIKGEKLMSYAEWESTRKEAKQQKQILIDGINVAKAERPPNLSKFRDCAQDSLNLIRTHREGQTSYNRVFQLKSHYRIGSPPQIPIAIRSLPASIVNWNFDRALQEAMFGVVPEIKEKVDLIGDDYSGTVKTFQKVLAHPDQYGLPADFQFPSELRELMTIAQEIAKVV